MKKNTFRSYFYLLLLLSVSICTAQKMPEIEALNRVILNHKDSIIYASVMPIETQSRVNPKTTRMYFWYAQHDIKNSRGNFSGKLLHGQYTAYYSDKSLKTKGHYKKGVRQGKWTAWNMQGEYAWRIRYKKGKRKGRFFEYSHDGQLVRKGFYSKKEDPKRIKIYQDEIRIKPVKPSRKTKDSTNTNDEVISKKSRKKIKSSKVETQDPLNPNTSPSEKKTKKKKNDKVKIKRNFLIFPQREVKST